MKNKFVKKAFVSALALLSATGVAFMASGEVAHAAEPDSVVEIFSDISEGDWWVDAVQYVYDNDLMVGKKDDIFDPTGDLTREQFVQVLYAHNGEPDTAAVNQFVDVRDNGWYKNAILWANENDLVAGYGDGRFGVGRNISREELAVILYKYASMNHYDLTTEAGKIAQFADADKVSSWARTAMDWAVTQGIMHGKGNGDALSSYNLDPRGRATRAECATMIWKLLGNDAVVLDGVKDHHLLTTDYCYIESEKYVLFLDKDLDIPGDFVVNLDAIVDEIEEQLGISSCPQEMNYSGLIDNSIYYGTNPWEGYDIGTKIPVFLVVDREAAGWISCASRDDAIFVEHELFSDEVWNSIPDYRDNPWRRRAYVDYSTFAHELTHTITCRNCYMTDCITEGIAEYMGRVVIDNLAPDYESIAEVKENRYLYDYSVPEAVNAQNAERIFVEDYQQISHAERGAEYVFGRYLCQFLNETYGDDFYQKYNDKVKELGLEYNSNYYTEEMAQAYADALKQTFGEDVFTLFGDWCVAKGCMQR